jgi:hypothetical protein
MKMRNNVYRGYVALAYEDYNPIAYKTSLKGLLKPFKGKGELQQLEENTKDAREIMGGIRQRLIQSATSYPIRMLPLIFTLGPAPSGAVFLRWRNQQNNKSGLPAFGEIIQNPVIPTFTRDLLLEIEKDRIVFNMQMSALTFIIRQARECQEKFSAAERLRNC